MALGVQKGVRPYAAKLGVAGRLDEIVALIGSHADQQDRQIEALDRGNAVRLW